MTPKLVIFDCDGVLVDTETVTNELLVERLADAGLKLGVSDAMELFVGGTIATVAERAREMGADLSDDWVEGTYAAMFERLREGVPLIPGIVELISAIERRGLPKAIASNGPPDKMDITLGPHGLIERFAPHIYSAHVVGFAKPDPRLYLHAAAAFGIDPKDTVVIEDSVAGATAARDAGMRCFGYARDTPAERLAAVGATVIADMRVLPVMLNLD